MSFNLQGMSRALGAAGRLFRYSSDSHANERVSALQCRCTAKSLTGTSAPEMVVPECLRLLLLLWLITLTSKIDLYCRYTEFHIFLKTIKDDADVLQIVP